MKKFLILLMLSSPAMASDPKQVIATVDGQKITRGELESSLAEIAELVDGGKPKLETFPKAFQQEFVSKFIDKLLLVEAGRKKGIHKTPVIRKKIRIVEDFLTQEQYVKDILKGTNSEKSLRAIYDEKLAKEENQIEANASHILVKTEEEAKAIKKKLDEGENFEELAKEKSIEPGAKISAGDLGYFVKETMVPAFAEAVFKMEKGQISKPVETDFGWHIIKLIDTREKKKLSFKEATPALKAELARRLLEEELSKLRASKEILYKLDFTEEKK